MKYKHTGTVHGTGYDPAPSVESAHYMLPCNGNQYKIGASGFGPFRCRSSQVLADISIVSVRVMLLVLGRCELIKRGEL